jgi:HEAT repeat protein
MLSVSPNRKERIAEARRLFNAGDKTGAWDVLVGDRYDHGIDPRIVEELRRLFPVAPPEVLSKLAAFQRQIDEPDDKERQKAVRRMSGYVLGSVSNDILQFVQPAETMTFFIKNLDHPDPVVQEHMTICTARALDKYIHDDRAFEPLKRMLTAARPNTRAWAVEGLAHLTDDFVPFALEMLTDKTQRVRDAASAALSLSLHGGGTIHRPQLGVKGRRLISEFMASYDLELAAKDRATRAWFLSETADPKHLPVLEAWYAKDKSKEVRKHLLAGIKRLNAG